jgi:hypothetical protein
MRTSLAEEKGHECSYVDIPDYDEEDDEDVLRWNTGVEDLQMYIFYGSCSVTVYIAKYKGHGRA